MHHKHIVVIGTSAGGVRALKSLISAIPANFNAPIFIIMHVKAEPQSPSHLPELIRRYSQLPAFYPFDGQAIAAGHIYIAPPNLHMIISDNRIFLRNGPKINHCRPAIDLLFASAAKFGSATTGILLSGMLNDGVSGLLAIKKNNGTTITQSVNEAEFKDMPKNALKSAIIDYSLPTKDIAALLIKIVSV
ncbi:MAG: chemotaxis protein CheB [Legionellaceae bacterium]|nr:chemotaxis protein CheB [Legionellaceae bacterium]